MGIKGNNKKRNVFSNLPQFRAGATEEQLNPWDAPDLSRSEKTSGFC